MEEKLLTLVSKIENSSLSQEEKDTLYDEIALDLRALVWPALYPHMPKDKMDALNNSQRKEAVVLTRDILLTAFNSPGAYEDIEKRMDEFIVEMNENLASEGIK